MQGALWWAAGGAAALALIAAAADWRRQRRRDLDRVGFMPWQPLQFAGILAAAVLIALALR